MTAVMDVLAGAFGGLHHTDALQQWKKKDYCETRCIDYLHRMELATFDSNHLTRLVVLCHDKGLRLSISPHKFYLLEFKFSNRMGRRHGQIYPRHPTIEQAVSLVRRNR
jgi:hypothetical protein